MDDQRDALAAVLADHAKPNDRDVGKLPKGGAQLAYVGHAAVTRILIEVDPLWSWEPMAFGDDGCPVVRVGEKEAEMWIRLTVLGKTLPAVGTANKGSFELSKQLISDALRNGAMRFGVALSLWSKEEWETSTAPVVSVTQLKGRLVDELASHDDPKTLAAEVWHEMSPAVAPWSPVRADEILGDLLHRAEVLAAS
jgi:hypothetical protein